MHACMHACMHSFTHSLTHSLIHSFIHSCIHAFMHLFIPSFICSFIRSFTHSFWSFVRVLFLPFVYPFGSSSIHIVSYSSAQIVCSYIHSLINWLIYSTLQMTTSRARLSSFQLQSLLSCYFFWLCSVTGTFITNVGDRTTQVRVTCIYRESL